jgi:Na+/proline symporter
MAASTVNASASLVSQAHLIAAILAYVDTTSGGILVQVLLGGGAGVIVLAGLVWKRARRMVNSLLRTILRLPRRKPNPLPDIPEHANTESNR